MEWARAIGTGLFRGRGKTLGALLVWFSGFILATIAINPMRRGFHVLFDKAPASKALLGGGGLDMLINSAMKQPAFWAAANAMLLYLVLLSVVLGLFLMAGVYAQASEKSGGWRSFWRGAAANVLPFSALFLFNLVLWVIVGVGVGVFLAAAWHGVHGSMDPAKPWHLFWITLGTGLFVLNLFRNSVGYGQARWVLIGREEGMGLCFVRSVVFTFRRFVPVNVVTWLFNAARAIVMVLAVFILSPGYESTGRWFATAVLLQAGFLVVAYLRVGEARTQVAYSRHFLAPRAETARTDVPVVPKDETPVLQEIGPGEVPGQSDAGEDLSPAMR